MIAEYDGYNNLLRKYIFGPGIDQPVSMIEVADANAVYYYHFDALGSVVALSDAAGDTVQTYEYSVFGEVAVEDANHPNPYMFAGVRYDIEIGLYYNRARYYNPFTGRFLQTDPVGYAAGMNLYAYCRNNPVGLTDPFGRDPCDPCGPNDPCGPGDPCAAKAVGVPGYSHKGPHSDMVDLAVEDAKTFVDDAIKRLERWNSKDVAEFVAVFGTASFRNQVLEEFRAIKKALNHKISWKESTLQPIDGSGAATVAHAIRGAPVEITLFPRFFELDRVGFQSRASTIIHEISHEAANTYDFGGYGRDAVADTARRYPSLAVGNADSLAAYAMREFR